MGECAFLENRIGRKSVRTGEAHNMGCYPLGGTETGVVYVCSTHPNLSEGNFTYNHPGALPKTSSVSP